MPGNQIALKRPFSKPPKKQSPWANPKPLNLHWWIDWHLALNKTKPLNLHRFSPSCVHEELTFSVSSAEVLAAHGIRHIGQILSEQGAWKSSEPGLEGFQFSPGPEKFHCQSKKRILPLRKPKEMTKIYQNHFERNFWWSQRAAKLAKQKYPTEAKSQHNFDSLPRTLKQTLQKRRISRDESSVQQFFQQKTKVKATCLPSSARGYQRFQKID